MRALDAARGQVPESGSAEPPRTRAAVDVDALAMLAEAFLAHGPAARDGGARHQVVVNVDVEVLADDDPDGVSELDDGVALAPETARRLACDASIDAVVRDTHGHPIASGRRSRTIPSGTRRAVHARDGGCRFPGCGERTYVDVHHVHHWAHGGSHHLTNLVELCWHHHRLVHEGGWHVRLDDCGEVAATRPDGAPLTVAPARPPGVDLVGANRARDVVTDAHTITPRWYGDPLHLGEIISGLAWLDGR